MTDIIMPEMGTSVKSAVITKWHKKVGDTILEDEILFEISTDKVESEIPSPVAGIVTAIHFEEGDECIVGTKLAFIEN